MDKDDGLDRLLRRTSRADGETRPVDGCLDAQTIAAWTDGSLTAREREAAETHAADCGRCLAILATVARTAPAPPLAQRSRWFPVRWLAPLATAAVVVVAWIVLDQRVAQPPVALRPPTANESSRPAEATTPAKPDTRAKEADTRASKDAGAQSTTRSRNEAARADALEKKAKSRAAEAPQASAPTSVQEVAGVVAQRFEAPADAASPGVTVLSPDPNVLWRISGRAVERSTDAGRTWASQATGADVDLLAGSSPAPAVCWIVGRRGTVLHSTDGESWARREPPDSTADLVRVIATDARSATVTTADGRTYQTADGGRTWTLQENPAAPF